MKHTWPRVRFTRTAHTQFHWPRYFTGQLIEPAFVLFALLSLAAGAGTLLP